MADFSLKANIRLLLIVRAESYRTKRYLSVGDKRAHFKGCLVEKVPVERRAKKMKIAATTLVLILVAGSAAAQTPKPTEIRGIPMGWSFAEFETATNMPAACGKDKSCKKEIANAESGKETWFQLDKDFKLCFANGVLVEMQLEYKNFDEFAVAATAKFGNPMFNQKQVLQNGFGAQFVAGLAQWNLPDGTVISADEIVSYNQFGGGYDRYTKVWVRNAARFAALHTGNQEPKL
ncbi:MAG: hypothetical protein WA817_23870 [Candidatus Acidiferrum sp.]